ncbi:exocyst complex component 4-like isoform X2 [Ornithodoros turicata]|uniref:exocyst complex component 4-like isoform X2 n=1 Tax=Ornithodoros turicata TaxID=34597 RepID=UPI0031390D09
MANFVSSSGGPIRPPRTFKTTKDSNGLLISVIRSLSASQSSADRDKEKAKLEKEFKRSDQKLDDLVSQNKEDLTKAMQDFSKISSKISMSREKIHSLKEKLTTCKVLLHCKRDELKKLWLEAIEHKHVLQLLEEIESLVEVPDKVNTFLNKKQYLHATKLLVSSVSLVEGSLEGVEALKDVKAKLIYKKEHMHEVLVEELHRHVYLRTTNEALQTFRRQGSDRRLQNVGSPAGKAAPRNTSTSSLMNGATGDNRGPTAGEDHLDLLKLEESGIADSSLHSSKYVAILVECLALLHKTPEMIETIKDRGQTELLSMVWRTTQFLLDNSQNISSQPAVSQPRLLLDLLDLLFDQFHSVVACHECILANVRRVTVGQNETETATYSVADVWTWAQCVMKYVIGKYLDIHNTGSTQQAPPPAFTEVVATNDIASYFTRRRNIKQKKFALFRFDCSSHAISMNTYLKEKKKEEMEEMKNECDYVEVGDSRQRLVCAPTCKNITYIFKPLMVFIEEVERVLKLEDGNHCSLYEHLVECVNIFLSHISNELENTIESATKSLETWKVISEPETLKHYAAQRPLLQSAVCVDHSLQGLQELMQALPMYLGHFLNLASNILQSYKETSQAAYRGVVQPESEDKRIISATWAKDEDISRFLMSLPNWANLQHLKENKGSVDVEESPEEVRLRNKKESEILIRNLTGGMLIPQHEILSDVAQLRVLAQLQESLEWLSSRIQAVASCAVQLQQQKGLSPVASKAVAQEATPGVQDVTVHTLKDLAKDFQEIADTCLLVLHLEVRVHCFYYLLPVTVQGNFASGVDNQEPDPEVTRLNKDLSAIDEAMTACLQQRKHRYIFEGLGHLIASILITSTSRIQRVNENGIKKVCRNIFAIQQNITSITMNREVALDHARQYFELFYHTPEDVLNLIVEHGSQFQEREYENVLQLLHKSLPSTDRDPEVLKVLLSRLRDILNEVAVAV